MDLKSMEDRWLKDRRLDSKRKGRDPDFFVKMIQQMLLIDKTLIVRDFLESQQRTVVILRPNFYGKSFSLELLNCFLSNRFLLQRSQCSSTIPVTVAVEHRQVLFKTTLVGQDEQFVNDHCGQYPIIYISFQVCSLSFPRPTP